MSHLIDSKIKTSTRSLIMPDSSDSEPRLGRSLVLALALILILIQVFNGFLFPNGLPIYTVILGKTWRAWIGSYSALDTGLGNTNVSIFYWLRDACWYCIAETL